MPRDLNDIIPPSRRKNIGDVIPPSARIPEIPARTPMDTSDTYSDGLADSSYEPAKAYGASSSQRLQTLTPHRFPLGTILIAAVVIIGCGAVFYSFSGAKVVVSPVSSPATVSADFIAYASTGDLTYQIISVEKTATADIKASGVSQVSDAAHGKITIHNSQSTKQALIKNTRFQSTDGHLYRIHDSIVVPAGGDLSVEVYADEPGDAFNIAPSSFTIPGLKGSPAFTAVTAKSGDAMTGGFVGQRATAPQDVKDKTYGTMQANLTTELQKDLLARVPAGYVLIPGASYPSYTPGPDVAKGVDTVTLSETGKISAVVFPEEALARAVAFKSIGTYDGSPASFATVDGLTAKPAEVSLAPDAPEFAFSISGTTHIVLKVDSDKIAGAVAGKTRDSAEVSLKSFLEIERATLVLRPFWAHSFPSDPKKIQVVVQKQSTGQ